MGSQCRQQLPQALPPQRIVLLQLSGHEERRQGYARLQRDGELQDTVEPSPRPESQSLQHAVGQRQLRHDQLRAQQPVVALQPAVADAEHAHLVGVLLYQLLEHRHDRQHHDEPQPEHARQHHRADPARPEHLYLALLSLQAEACRRQGTVVREDCHVVYWTNLQPHPYEGKHADALVARQGLAQRHEQLHPHQRVVHRARLYQRHALGEHHRPCLSQQDDALLGQSVSAGGGRHAPRPVQHLQLEHEPVGQHQALRYVHPQPQDFRRQGAGHPPRLHTEDKLQLCARLQFVALWLLRNLREDRCAGQCHAR